MIPRTSTTAYSNNAALVLLDYITNSDYGPGWDINTDIDLASFRTAADICGEIVQGTGISAGTLGRTYTPGVTWQQAQTTAGLYDGMTNIPLSGFSGNQFFGSLANAANQFLRRYEFNGSVNTSDDHRDNISTILDVIPGVEFFRSPTGQWKLVVPDANRSAVVQAGMERIDEDDLIGNIAITYTDSTDKLNQLDIRYTNLNKDFAEDSILFPQPGSSLLTAYLAEDNQLELRDTRDVIGINNIYHAISTASNTIAQSRREVYSFSSRPAGFIYEPGDIVRLVDGLANVDVYVKILTTRVNSQLNVEFTAIRFDPADYGWLIDDIEAFEDPGAVLTDVAAPTSVTATYRSATRDVLITWTPSADEDATVNGYTIEARQGTGSWITIANVLAEPQEAIHSLGTEVGNYTYRIRAVTSDGRRSAPSNISGVAAVNNRQDFFQDLRLYFQGDEPPAPFSTTIQFDDSGAPIFTPPTGWTTTVPNTTDAIWIVESAFGARAGASGTVVWGPVTLFRGSSVTTHTLSGGGRLQSRYLLPSSTSAAPLSRSFTITATPTSGSVETATFGGTLPTNTAYGDLVAGSFTFAESADTTNSFTLGPTVFTRGFTSRRWTAVVTHDSGATITIEVEVLPSEIA